MTMAPRTLIYVTSPDCRFCVDGTGSVDALAREFGMAIVELEWDSRDGTALVEGAGALFPPAVVVDGQLLGYGRVSERRLRRSLAKVAA